LFGEKEWPVSCHSERLHLSFLAALGMTKKVHQSIPMAQSKGARAPSGIPPSGLRLGAFWGFALIFGAVVVAYFPALHGAFLWNDSDYVTPLPLRSLAGLGRIWFEVGATQQYYPALHTAFWIEHRLWGDSAVGYHLANVLLHATSACLFVVLLRRLRVPGAYFAGFIFALHPVGVESVAWISEQKNTLSTVFYLLSALVYLRWQEGELNAEAEGGPDASPRPSLYWVATASFIFALLSKSVTATLPAALLVMAWWQRGRLGWRRDIVPLLPWFALGAAAGLFTAWVEHSLIGAKGSDFDLSLAARVGVAGRAVWFYLGKLFWPANLIFIYPRWDPDTPEAWTSLSPVAVLALFAGLWVLRSRSRAPLAAGLIFVGALFPVLGFFNVYAFVFSFVADHFQYLASLGVIALAAAGATLACQRLPRRARWAGPVVAAGLLGTLGLRTFAQSRNYRDSETLYRSILAKNPDAWMAQDNLGTILRDSGRLAEAVDHYTQALWAKPGFAEGHNNLGVALVDSGHPAEAIEQFEKAVRLRPDFPEAEDNLGSALARSGQTSRALEILGALVQRYPGFPAAHNNYGLALAQAGRLPEAVEQCREALRLDPDYADARRNLGLILQAMRPSSQP
jgi:tetratricopeptide (TPR) repeat protein